MGSIVRSTGYRVLHRAVEPAGILGNWEFGASHDPKIQPARHQTSTEGYYSDMGVPEVLNHPWIKKGGKFGGFTPILLDRVSAGKQTHT